MEQYFDRRFSYSAPCAGLVMTHVLRRAAAGTENLAAGAEYRLLFLQKGDALCGRTKLREGDCVFLEPGKTARLRFGCPSVLCGVGFRGEDAARLAGLISSEDGSAAVRHAVPHVFSAIAETAVSLPGTPAGDTRRTGMLYELLSGLLPDREPQREELSYGRRAMDYMRENFTQPIGIADVAKAVGVSRSWLYRCFMEYAEQPPAIYLRGLRMERAKSLLRRTALSVQETAYAVGFEDALYFSRVFSEYTGLSPSLYRRQFGAE